MTIAIRPSWRAGTGGVVGLIWGRGEEVYFRGEDWTGQIRLIALEKLARSRIAGLARPQFVVQRKYGFRSARLHFPTRWTVLACPNSACLRGPRREPVFLFASARGGFDAHGMLRSSSLAHLRWWRGSHWKRFASIYPLALTSIPSGTPVCLRTCSPPLVALGCGTGGTSKNAKFGNRGARRRAGWLRFFRC